MSSTTAASTEGSRAGRLTDVSSRSSPAGLPESPSMVHVVHDLGGNIFECKRCGIAGSLYCLGDVACEPEKHDKMRELVPSL